MAFFIQPQVNYVLFVKKSESNNGPKCKNCKTLIQKCSCGFRFQPHQHLSYELCNIQSKCIDCQHSVHNHKYQVNSNKGRQIYSNCLNNTVIFGTNYCYNCYH